MFKGPSSCATLQVLMYVFAYFSLERCIVCTYQFEIHPPRLRNAHIILWYEDVMCVLFSQTFYKITGNAISFHKVCQITTEIGMSRCGNDVRSSHTPHDLHIRENVTPTFCHRLNTLVFRTIQWYTEFTSCEYGDYGKNDYHRRIHIYNKPHTSLHYKEITTLSTSLYNSQNPNQQITNKSQLLKITMRFVVYAAWLVLELM